MGFILASARAFEFNDVVGLEAVDQTVVFVREFCGQFRDGEVRCQMSKFAGVCSGLSPNLISGMEEIFSKNGGVLSVVQPAPESDVVKAYIERLALKPSPGLLVVGVSVEVFVNRVVIDHLGYGEIVKEIGIACALQILGEDLHQEGFADSGIPDDEKILFKFVMLIREYL